MTPNEFKAWFDGFTEAFEGRIPTKAQWGRIKDRVAEIDGKPVTERIYVDRYWPTYVKYSQPGTYWTTYTGATAGACATGIGGLASSMSQAMPQNAGYATAFNSTTAMLDLGRAEAKALAA